MTTRTPLFIALFFICQILLLGSCATSSPGKAEGDSSHIHVELYDVPGSDVPAFRGVTRIRSSVEQTMMVLTDYSLLPRWAWGVRSARLLKLVSYSEAYIYQVIQLPFVTDRDMIIHGVTSREGKGKAMLIELDAVEDYCEKQVQAPCEELNDTNRVRVTRSRGTIRVRQVEPGFVEITWQQHLEPGGLIPAWATRLMLKRIPLKSLSRLRTLVESRG